MQRVGIVLLVCAVICLVLQMEIIHQQNSAEESFCATVLEVRTGSVVVEPLEGEEIRQTSDQISFGTANLETIGAAVGDTVKITFDGVIRETNPAQIVAQKWKMLQKSQIHK